jgi:hypothetical protein
VKTHVCHCWMGRKEAAESAYEAEHGDGTFMGSDEWIATWHDDWKDGTCMLEADHAGAHEFVDDDKIGVRFAPAEDQPS